MFAGIGFDIKEYLKKLIYFMKRNTIQSKYKILYIIYTPDNHSDRRDLAKTIFIYARFVLLNVKEALWHQHRHHFHSFLQSKS